ncbi:MAPEG family protein [Cyanobium gracile]|uniref:MAPEG family n=1 Tax=Cyanobium gracile (strain ATCC 27147 / PCC 6307) TaxID=292564 RepID=K9P8T4_CYAGP|nr:MAPEG family protein [Cyanobium gracile]AFY29348.1 MAPEG family [Cyanobium gracile PCC 6307]
MVPPIPALVTVLALLTYQATGLLVGRARVVHGVKPPAMTGPAAFERALRVQQNTLEQLVFFLPSFWLAVLLDNAAIASALGLVWVGGRIAYAAGYLQAAEKRGPGFGISFLSGAVLLVMAVAGALRAAL